MAFDALLFKKYPDLYDHHVGFRRPPLDYLLIVLGTLAGLVALPFSPATGVLLLVLAVALVLAFAMRRLRGLSRSPRQVADMVISSFAIPFTSLWWRLVGAWRWRVAFF